MNGCFRYFFIPTIMHLTPHKGLWDVVRRIEIFFKFRHIGVS